MKTVHTFIMASGFALASAGAHAQTAGQDQSTPQPANPAAQQTQPAPNAQLEQPVRPDTYNVPGTGDAEQTTALAQEDERFLENAIQGSYAEIEGSQLALDKSEDPEVRDFAQMMIQDHQQMVDETSALATEKGMTPPDGPSVMQTTEITALRALTGGAFDAMYINRIGVAAHESTIEMFEQADQEVQDPDVKALITKALPKLREHLNMAQTLNEKQENQ